MKGKASRPKEEALRFSPRVTRHTLPVMTAGKPKSVAGVFKWKGAPAYKNERLAYYQKRLAEKGITDGEHVKLLTAQLIQEARSLSEATVGDNGCSVGILQYNACVHHGLKAKAFLEKYPAWKDWRYQLDRMADMVGDRYAIYGGDIRRIVVHHNHPAAAKRGIVTRYYHDVAKRLPLLTTL